MIPAESENEESDQQFVRCGHCGMPHHTSLSACPYTGRTIAMRARLPESAGAVEEALKPIAGTVLEGKYRVGELLGTGSMGAVYAAEHLDIERELAIKVLLRKLDEHSEAVARFLREARATGQITHPHVVRLYDVGHLPDGAPYLVMERLRGEELAAKLAREGRLSQGSAVQIAIEILDGLAAAHAHGVVHRDVKPSNVFLAALPEGGFVTKLCDFSISHLAEVERLTLTGQVLGTPHFLSPEQAQGEAVDKRTDIWAVGIVLYQLLTGTLPFDGVSLAELLTAIIGDPLVPPKRVQPDLHPDIDAIITVALQKDPKFRFPNAESMARALSEVGAKVDADQTVQDAGPLFDEPDDPSVAPAVDVPWADRGDTEDGT